jgi:intein/homing endonuclease
MPIESVMAGERVFLEDGATAEVAAVIDRGVLPVVTLTLKHGYSLTATTLHRVRVLDEEGDYIWRRIGKIRPTDCVVIQPGHGLHNELPKEVFPSLHKSHFNEREVKTPESVDERLATLLGYLTGDGTLQSGRVGWVVNIQDQGTADLIEQWAKELFGLPIYHRGSYRGVAEYAIYSTLLLRWLKEIGISKNQIPDFVWRSSPRIVTSYLRGIFESDGSVSDDETGKVSFGSSRERLAREVHQLLLALGIPATLRHQRNTGPNRQFSCWIVSVLASGIKQFYEQVGFISSRKQGKLTSLVSRWTGRTVAGNMPNLKRKISGLEISGDPRRLLANTWCLGRTVSHALALNIEKNYPEIAQKIGLKHITEYRQLFIPVVSIEPAGNQHVYDLTVPGPTTYISNGFVSHNSQIEMRILADFARDEVLLEAFDSGADLHRMTASQMFGVPLDQVTPRQRESAKGLNYGLVYGMGAEGLASRIESSVKEAEILIERYFAAYSGVERWLNEAAERAVRERRARTASGRLWIFRFDPHDRSQLGALKRVGKNAPIQGSASDIFKRAMTLLDRALLSHDAQIVNSIHDEIVVECEESIAEEVKQIVIRKMIEGAKEFLPRVPVEVEAVISDAWLKK